MEKMPEKWITIMNRPHQSEEVMNALILMREMAEELQEIQNEQLPELNDEFESLKKFKEWK